MPDASSRDAWMRRVHVARWLARMWLGARHPDGRPLSWKRRANLYLNRLEAARLRTRLWSRPWHLIVEPTNACNLRCPYCFTGAGGRGRKVGRLPVDAFRRVLDEIGDYLVDVELFGWGEPLLHPDLPEMIRAAASRDVFTVVNTNLSLPFDAAHAEALVGSGLHSLTVSIDGADQATYEGYRVGGDLALVVRNCELLTDARRRLGRTRPGLAIEFHPFPHSAGQADAMRALADRLGMELRIYKGQVPGREWGTEQPFRFCTDPTLLPCTHPWSTLVLASDGGLAPCRGTFYRQDDMGRLAMAPGDGGAASVAAVWNGARYLTARRLFTNREAPATDPDHPCVECPNTVAWDRWRRHEAQGGTTETFALGYGTNDAWNYFWRRVPKDPARSHLVS